VEAHASGCAAGSDPAPGKAPASRVRPGFTKTGKRVKCGRRCNGTLKPWSRSPPSISGLARNLSNPARGGRNHPHRREMVLGWVARYGHQKYGVTPVIIHLLCSLILIADQAWPKIASRRGWWRRRNCSCHGRTAGGKGHGSFCRNAVTAAPARSALASPPAGVDQYIGQLTLAAKLATGR